MVNTDIDIDVPMYAVIRRFTARCAMLHMKLLLTAAVIGHFVATCQASRSFQVVVDKTGGYVVTVDRECWLKGAPTFFTVQNRHFTTADGSLALVRTSQDSGSDNLGQWNTSSFVYQPMGTVLEIEAVFKWYDEIDMVLFGQHYPSGLNGTSVGDISAVNSGFPSFYMEDASQTGRTTELGFLAFGGIMTGDTEKSIGIWNNSSKMESGLDSGPLILFDKDENAVIVAPFNNFMSASAQYSARAGAMTATWGLLGAADHVPSDFRYWTSLTFSASGVNQLMEDWGRAMRIFYKKTRAYTDSDWTNNYIGYWTDRGGYYYYTTEPHMNYEDTILAVKEHADQKAIPFRYIEYDSWFYPKGRNEGVTEWDSMMNIFPHGMKYVWEKTGWPVVGHNRWWSDAAVYAKQNGGRYNFIVESHNNISLPLDQTFWDDLMEESKMWGLVSYEQDWLNIQFDTMDATTASVTLGRQWLHQMAKGAAKSGIYIQYCMAPSRHALTSLELPVVSQSRVSQDYLPGNSNWRIGVTSMFAHALGVAPYKDNFWTTRVQPGNVYNGTEPNTVLHVVAATLSTGPVAPSDRIGYMDVPLIMRSCNKDGLILKPSRPAMCLDKQLMLSAYSGFTGEVWSTYSGISGLRFGVILGAAFRETDKFSIRKRDAGIGFEGNASLRVFPWGKPSALRLFDDDHPVILAGCTNTEFCLLYSSPVIYLKGHSIILLGELEKFVPMSPKRVTSISISEEDVTLSLTGAVMETVTMTTMVDDTLSATSCVLGQSGTTVLSVIQKTCS